jgi:NDP-sugar pyrophosphorylase family protein
MAINFPNLPANGDKYTVNNTTWTYNSAQQSWTAQLDGGSFVNPLIVSNTVSFGNTTVNGWANVASYLQVGGNTSVTGQATFANTLAVTGNAAFSNTLTVAGNTTITSKLSVGGNATVNGTLTVNSTSTFSDNVTITGSLVVTGTTTFVNSNIFQVSDEIVTLNADLDPSATPTSNVGFEVNRGVSANVSFVWDETNDRWAIGNTYVTGKVTTTANVQVGDTLLVGANGIQYSDGTVQTTYLDPIVYAIALG